MSRHLTRAALLVYLLTTIQACVSVSESTANRIDLSGEWRLDGERSDPTPDLDALRENEDKRLLRGIETDPMESIQLVNLYFPIVSTNSILIEQEEESMGVQYEGQPYKDLSWGRHEYDGWTQRVEWNRDSLTVSTTRGGVRGKEIFKILDDGAALEVVISIRAGVERINLRRLFQRAPATE